MSDKIRLTEEEWRQRLSPEQYAVTREAGTEPAFSGEYHDSKEPGIYACACCGHPRCSITSRRNARRSGA